MRRPAFLGSVRRIATLAWPVLVGQLAVLAFSTIDTLLVARAGALDLAALAIGASAYITIFIGLMGVVLAVGPIAGQLYGAKQLAQAGEQLHQAVWLALLLSLPGCALLLFPQPFLELARAEPAVAAKVRGYLGALAFALPCALVFTAFRGFNNAVSRPKIVMALQLGALLLKLPLSALLVFGGYGVPALGAPGCGIATAVCMALMLLGAWQILRRDPFYAPFALGTRLRRPQRASLRTLLRLGVPMGASVMVEVTGFSFMAFFIARFGTVPVAGHQIALNLVSAMFMVPLAIANASSTLVAQAIGADDLRDARRVGWHSLELCVVIATAMGGAVYLLRAPILGLYTGDAAIAAAALPLLTWVALFHVADAAQTVAAFVLRAWRIAVVPMLIYVAAIWGVGLGGGYTLAFDLTGAAPPALQGALGFWSAATAGLVLAGSGLAGFLLWMLRRQRARTPLLEAPLQAESG
ncbi:MAG: MATE family efflux transporter [Piscinibacter sp.]|nr:MATE family efflux transporter [Piscinibacter sp.]